MVKLNCSIFKPIKLCLFKDSDGERKLFVFDPEGYYANVILI